MGKLLYYNGEVAVSDFTDDNTDLVKAIELLLNLDFNRPIPKGHLKTLLECRAIPTRAECFLGFYDAGSEQAYKLNTAIKDDAFSGLGFFIIDADGDISVIPDSVSTWEQEISCLRYVLDVDAVKKRIVQLAESLQYLARLYLLSVGEMRCSDMLPDISYGKNALEFAAELPSYIAERLSRIDLDTQAHFSKSKSEELSPDSRYQAYTVSVSYDEMPYPYQPNLAYYDEMQEMLLLPDKSDLKRITAGYLLSSLLCYLAPLPYEANIITNALGKRGDASFTDELAGLMIAGKIRPCPKCARPVLKKREKSKMYCSDSCRTLYNRKAHEMLLRNGASVDEVHEAFPAIPKETIRAWRPNGRTVAHD